MKQCELCDHAARMYCESDQASLCWDCDAKVHGANFLVAKHSRCLLCRSCQAPTPWRAEGARLGPTVSVCDRCADAKPAPEAAAEAAADADEPMVEGDTDGDEDDDGDGEDDEEDEEEEEDGENQVVPWSMTPPPPPPPPVAASSSSSSDDEGSGRRGSSGGFLKRMRENDNLSASQDDVGCSSSQVSYLSSGPAPGHQSSYAAVSRDNEASSAFVVGGNSSHSFRQLKRTTFLRTAPGQFSSNALGAAGFDPRIHGDHRAVDVGLSSSSGRPLI